MRIYLDLWVFQYWVQGKLLTPQEKQFYGLLNSNEYQVILSSTHLIELLACQDQSHSIKVARLLDALSNKIWIRNLNDLTIMEIKDAYRHFRGWPRPELNPFVKRPVDTFEPNVDSLEHRLYTENISIEGLIRLLLDKRFTDNDNLRKQIGVLAAGSADIAQNLSKEKWQKKVKERLKEVLRWFIIENELAPEEEREQFINYLMHNPRLIIGYYFPFHLQHYLHRNSKNFPISNIGDLSVCSTIPYVDQIVLDGKMYDKTEKATKCMVGLKEVGPEIMVKLNKSITELVE